jgi:hypothetical protein
MEERASSGRDGNDDDVADWLTPIDRSIKDAALAPAEQLAVDQLSGNLIPADSLSPSLPRADPFATAAWHQSNCSGDQVTRLNHIHRQQEAEKLTVKVTPPLP